MSGNTQRGHITGNGQQELQFLKFHNLSSAPLAAYTGQFYYDTTIRALKIYDASWYTIPFVDGSLGANVVPVLDDYNIIPITPPVATSFYKVNPDSTYLLSQYISFSDIDSSAYKTTIVSPGVNTKLVTEKAVVDYFATNTSVVSYLGLTDTTDSSYTGKASAVPMVNTGETGLELIESELAVFTILDDVPDTYTGKAGYTVKVNGTATGLEFVDVPPTINTVTSTFLKLTFAANNLTVAPYTVKKVSDPGYPYLYITDTTDPTYTNLLTLDGHFKPTKLTVNATNYVGGTFTSTSGIALNVASTANYPINAQSFNDAYSSINALISSSSTNIVKKPLQIAAYSSGTPVSGFGVGQSFYLQRVSGGSYESGYIANKVTTLTSSAETTSFEWWLNNAGVLAKKMELTGAGQLLIPTAKIGDSTNNTEFEADGTIKFNGTATVYDDLLPSSVTIGSGANAPSFTSYNGNLKAYEFVGSGATPKELNLGFQIPHTYKEESSIEPHIHLFIPDDVTGGGIKFYCEYTWTNRDQAGSVATTTVSGTITRTGAQGINNNAILSFGTIAGTGKTISSIFMCRIYRDPADVADTFGVSTWLKSADIHFEKDGIGSRTITTK